MSEILYEELSFHDDKHLILSLDKIIETINFDPQKVEQTLYKKETTKEYALSRVDEKALQKLIESGDRSVATHDCSVYKFNNISFNFLHDILMSHFKEKNVKSIAMSGRIWYPVNGYMGWHTNSNNMGYRIYCTYAREEGKSFFRYRDPYSKEIITSYDKQGWNFRMFKISYDHLWHCIYSETDRLSIGYSLYI